ncbi:MAG: DUF2971 domain-containing protein [Candidatus Methylomirabilales bacterium]
MKIYKFKDLTDESKHSHFLQILLDNAIWCAKPDSLNDPDEFKFRLDYQQSPHTAGLLAEVMTRFKTTNYLPPNVSASIALQNRTLEGIAVPIIDWVVRKCRTTIGITSFSATKSDARLWDEYGGKGNGVCIEMNVPDSLIGQFYHRVRYVKEKVFHVDSFLEAALFEDRAFETYRNILLTKTKKWSEEDEIRFIGKRQEVNLIVDGYVSEVTFGANVPTPIFDQLSAAIGNHCAANNIRIVRL